MYLAIADETINKRRKEVKRKNETIINEFYRKPFYERWFKEENVKEEIIGNWHNFQLWMTKRISEKENHNLLT